MTEESTEQGVQDAFAVLQGFFESVAFDKRADFVETFKASFDAANALRVCALSQESLANALDALQTACVRFLQASAFISGARRSAMRSVARAALYSVALIVPLWRADWRLFGAVVPCAIIDRLLFGDSLVFRTLARVASACWNRKGGK